MQYIGKLGSSLFIVPNEDYTMDKETNDKYFDIYIQYVQASQVFDINEFLTGDSSFPYKARVEQYSNFLRIKTYETYVEFPPDFQDLDF
jgi:hypothetical protein